MKSVQIVLCSAALLFCHAGEAKAPVRAQRKPIQKEQTANKCYWKSRYRKMHKGGSGKQTCVGVNVNNGCGAGIMGPPGPPGVQGPGGPPGPIGPGTLPSFIDVALAPPLVDPVDVPTLTDEIVPFDTLGEKTENMNFCCSGNAVGVVFGGSYRAHFFVKVVTDDEITGISLKINGYEKPIPIVNIKKQITGSWPWATTYYYIITGEAITVIPNNSTVSLVMKNIPYNGLPSFKYVDNDVPTANPVYFSLIRLADPAV